MAFHIDCKGRHGLRSIDKKPASYQGWQCDACQMQIPDNCIGVLHCARCAVDICPACWTRILPKIVNAAGYPCFWVDSQLYGNSSWQMPQGPSSVLVCHRPDDCMECGMFVSAYRHQCQECLTLTRTMQIGAGAARAAPPAPTQPQQTMTNYAMPQTYMLSQASGRAGGASPLFVWPPSPAPPSFGAPPSAS